MTDRVETIAAKLERHQPRALDGFARLGWLPPQVWPHETPALLALGLVKPASRYNHGGHEVTELGWRVANYMRDGIQKEPPK